MRRRSGDDHRRLADLEVTYPVVDRHPDPVGRPLDAVDDRLDHAQGHRRVGLVLEVTYLLAHALLADVADEGVDPARAAVGDRGDHLR